MRPPVPYIEVAIILKVANSIASGRDDLEIDRETLPMHRGLINTDGQLGEQVI
jgi:hypothetical protein